MKNITKIDQHVWEIRFSFIDELTGERRRVRRRVEGSLKDAKDLRDRLRVQALDGTLGTGTEPRTERNLATWWDDYKYHREHMDKVAYSTRSREELVAEAHIIPAMGKWRPAYIETRHIDAVVMDWMRETKPNGTPYSPTTIHNRTKLALRFLAWVYRRIGRDRAHLADVAVPSKAQVEKGRALSPAEAQSFLEALKVRNPMAHVLTLTLLITGQRWGSVTALRWEDVDLDEKVVVFAQSHYRGKVKAKNKSGKVVRLPIPDALSEALTEHRNWMLRTQHVNVSTGLVFPTDRPAENSAPGGYRCAGDIRTLYHNAAVEAEIETPTPHDLRRTAITWMIDTGVSGTVVRAIAGHSNAAMTDHYYRGDVEAKKSSLDHITEVIKVR